MIWRLGMVLGCALAAALFVAATVHLVIEIHRAHTGPNLCYDIQHGKYVSCGGSRIAK